MLPCCCCYYITSYAYTFQDASCWSSGIHKLPTAATAVRPVLYPALFFSELARRAPRNRKSVTMNIGHAGAMTEEGKFHTICHEKRESCFSVLFLCTRRSHCFATSLLTPEPIAGLQVPSYCRQRPRGEETHRVRRPFRQQHPAGCPACRKGTAFPALPEQAGGARQTPSRAKPLTGCN